MRQMVMWGAGILISAGFLSYEQPLSSAAVQGPNQAVIVAGDGYGVNECLTSGEACGSLVAEGWCKSNGFSRLIAYRKASREDIMGAAGTLVTDEKNGESVVINCGS
jgi:hypothetical protein